MESKAEFEEKEFETESCKTHLPTVTLVRCGAGDMPLETFYHFDMYSYSTAELPPGSLVAALNSAMAS